MAGGPLAPINEWLPATQGKVFPNVHLTAGSRSIPGLGVMASLSGDAIYSNIFALPRTTLPTGTCTFVCKMVANATTGNAKINIKWARLSATANLDAVVGAEGVQTVSWAAGDNDDTKEYTVTLDQATPTAGESIYLEIVFETSSWTLAQVLTVFEAHIDWI